ncbi:MAG: DNA polymerase III subunit delta [Planctomycetota bacterium]
MARKPAAAGPMLDPASPLVVLHGKQTFLRADYTQQLKAKLLDTHGDLETLHFDGLTTPVAEVLDECRSFGLMQQHKLVVVDNADQLIKGDARPLMERYAESPVEAATLMLRCDTWNRGNLDKLITKAGGEIVKCEDVSPQQALAWATARAVEAHGATLPRDAAQLLVERVGGDLGRIDSELGKLAIEAPPAGKGKVPTIGAEQVAELVGMTREEVVWTIQELILTAGPEELLTQLRTILGNSKQDQTVVTFFAAMDLCRKLHAAARGFEQRMNPADIAKRLKLWGPSRDAILGIARRLDAREASELLSLAVDADRKSKSGLGKPSRMLECLTLEVAGRSRR